MRTALLILTLFCATMLNAAEWFTNYNQALARAKAQNKPVLVGFTGSDWCVWCIKLDKEVLATPEFNDWAQKNVVLLKVDFPRNIEQDEATKEANRALAEKFKVQGFPTILILTPDGMEKARTGYRRGGVTPYITYLNTLLK